MELTPDELLQALDSIGVPLSKEDFKSLLAENKMISFDASLIYAFQLQMNGKKRRKIFSINKLQNKKREIKLRFQVWPGGCLKPMFKFDYNNYVFFLPPIFNLVSSLTPQRCFNGSLSNKSNFGVKYTRF